MSFADKVDPDVRRVLDEAEVRSIRGQAQAAERLLRDTAAALGPDLDDDRVAIGELAMVIASWAGRVRECYDLLESLADNVRSPAARGALLFHRGRGGLDERASRFLSQALGEFTVAGDERGRALTLGQMCFPTLSSLGAENRLRLGREGLDIALRLDDPWAIAFCAGRLAICETCLCLPDAMTHWAQASEPLEWRTDAVTGEIAALNTANWAATALVHGDHATARAVIRRGHLLSRGPRWVREFAGLDALLAVREGRFDEVGSLAEVATADGVPIPVAAISLSAVALERARRLDTDLAEAAREQAFADPQMQWLARSVAAAIRVVRHEPAPLRGLWSVIEEASAEQCRFGWEDVVLVMAEHDPPMAERALAALANLLPTYPRGQAVLTFARGLVARTSGYVELLAAADAFRAIGEPITVAKALHAAARVAPSIAEGNRLRREALGLFEAAGAHRSLATLVRERRLHRGDRLATIPESQRHSGSAGLTEREREVAVLAAQGLTATEIAAELQVSVGTVRSHLLKVRTKFGGVPKRKLGALLNLPPTAQ